jgi:hypothetical protein
MDDGDNDLRTIVSALVNHWGASRVEDALTALTGSHLRPAISRSRESGIRKKPKLTPVQAAERLINRARNKKEIIEIARAFEAKAFLPRVGDVKDFLDQNGHESLSVRDRITGFRKVLIILKKMPADRLRALRNDAFHAGPVRLGPLSEAISAAGERIRSEKNAS